MLSPIRLKNGCSPTLTKTYKSPDGPPKRPASPLPGTRMRAPVSKPGGNSTFRVSVPRTRPSPPQSLHGVIERPEPPQSPHVTANCRCPLMRVVLPVPRHGVHTLSIDPGACPIPLQVPQACLRSTEILIRLPRIDSSKFIETWCSRSPPRSGFRRSGRLAKTCRKISPNSEEPDRLKSKP